MDSETLRTFLLEYLKDFSRPDQQNQLGWDLCYRNVSRLVRDRRPSDIGSGELLRDEDAALLKHIVWDLVIERVLVPGTNHPRTTNDGWPFLSITSHGKKVIAEQRPTPYDPDGYLAALKKFCPSVSLTVVEYLAEAIGTFRTGNSLASAVMLGAASEMVFDELSIAIPQTLSDQAKRDKLASKMQRGKMKDRIAATVGWCCNNRAILPGTWSGDEQVEDIERIADLIRRRRNEAGHPQDPPKRPTRDQMYSYLMVFPEYCTHLYVLKDWADKNAIS